MTDVWLQYFGVKLVEFQFQVFLYSRCQLVSTPSARRRSPARPCTTLVFCIFSKFAPPGTRSICFLYVFTSVWIDTEVNFMTITCLSLKITNSD